jgi:3-oxoisoapionate kinase
MEMPILNHDIFLSFYGDDFTGSTDVMESLAMNGIPTALFLQAPEQDEVKNFRLKLGVGGSQDEKRLKAFGVAGISRSLSPERMDQELPGIFEKISKIPTDFFQYKVCSTFDSAPGIGNVGHATELALKHFPSGYIPLLIGAPFLNRFVVFGNLFARVDQTTYRLDRHPTMSKHPVTPMHESDLRKHLGQQTQRNVMLMDLHALEGSYGEPMTYYQNMIKGNGNFLLFDTLNVDHLTTIGQLLVENKSDRTQFFVGASGANYALAFYLQKMGKIHKPASIPSPGRAKKMVIMAGSCSPVTAGQIGHMEKLGHPSIRINTVKLVDPVERTAEIENTIQISIEAIGRGQVPILYSAKGPDDPAIELTKIRLNAQGHTESETGEILAGAQGRIIHGLIDKIGKARIVVAGGDTSGYVSRTLGIYALETLCPIAPGAPLCIAHSKDNRFDGLEISLKGGQNGDAKYFESILEGKQLNLLI